MKSLLKSLVFAGLLSITPATVNAGTNSITFKSSEKQTALIELYTSEGCSSCPPAERWLSAFRKAPGLWTDFVPLAFHVDYWDRLGWADPWASSRFTVRQRAYANAWHGDTIYTPEVVLNGRELRDWAAWPGPSIKAAPNVGRLIVAGGGDRLRVTYSPESQPSVEFAAHAVWLNSGLTSDVKAGENQGRKLSHDFVVLNLFDAQLRQNGDSWAGEISATPPHNSGKSTLGFVVWITRKGGVEPIQATGGWVATGQ